MAIATVSPGSAVDPNPIDRKGLLSLFANGIFGPAIGIAHFVPEMTIEEFEVRRTQVGALMVDEPWAHIGIGEATAGNDAAWPLFGRDRSKAHVRADAGEVPSAEKPSAALVNLLRVRL